MYLVWQILIGILAGFLAGKIMRGRGFGILVDLLLGIVGSILGGFLFGVLGLYAAGLVGRLVVATVGAIVLLFLIRRLS
ncbi:MAG TPA: GlsB/YeaQ/YmgE family stress response membrane protein [Vicinamibacterales bacterium]|nr:GlsB/YeaQ/YmgE family stress response membrane protein [Vicinamibacterales bacterium]